MKICLNNEFINNLSLNDKNIFFLNTYGSLYSISKKDMKINWFVNLNQSKTLNPSNLFYGNEVVTKKNKVVEKNKSIKKKKKVFEKKKKVLEKKIFSYI